jgi:hypothetical protein
MTADANLGNHTSHDRMPLAMPTLHQSQRIERERGRSHAPSAGVRSLVAPAAVARRCIRLGRLVAPRARRRPWTIARTVV